MDKNAVKQFEIDAMRYSLRGEPLILDKWISEMAVNNAKFLDERIRLVVKPRPKLIPDKLWLKLASLFLEIHSL